MAATCLAAGLLLALASPAGAAAPGTPEAPTAVAGVNSVTVTFNTDLTTSPAVTTYTIIALDEDLNVVRTESVAQSSNATLSHNVTDLTNGTAYTFKVSARNPTASSTYSVASSAATPFGVPGAPSTPTLTAGNTSLTVVWAAPSSDGGDDITGYTANASYNSEVVASCETTGAATVTCDITTLTDGTTALTNGRAYSVTVTATNSAGDGTASAAAAGTPATTPGAPSVVAGTAGDGQVIVTWELPSTTGGSDLTKHRAVATPGGAYCDTTDGTTTTCTITGLDNGSAYTFKVTATTAMGDGTASSASDAVTPITTPGVPTSLAGTAADASVALTWTAPTDTGGSAITDYTVESSSDSGTTWTTFADGSGDAIIDPPVSVTGLTNGTAYTFRVSAVNAAGTGTASATASATPVTTPGTPTALSGTADDTSVVLNWTAPTVTGGTAITDYTVESSSDSGTTWTAFSHDASTTASLRVTGLTNGTAYTFRVSAVNAVGTGTASATASATPVTTPTAATSVAGTAGDTQVTLTWTAPTDNGGSAITDYAVEYSSDAGTTWTTFADGTSTTASATVTGLTNGTSYTFRASPVNAVGTGTASTASAAVVPVTTPGVPTAVAATADGTTATVTWTAPTVTGGTAITGYKVEQTVDDGTTWATATADTASTAVTATYSDLTSGASYSFRVSAINAVGTGTASTASVAVQTGPPAGAVNAWLATDEARNFLAILAFAGQEAADQVAANTAAVETWVDSADGRRFLGLPTKAEEEAAATWADSADGRRFLGLPTKAEEEAATTAWLATDEATNWLGEAPTTTEEWLATDNATAFLEAIAAAEAAEAAAAAAEAAAFFEAIAAAAAAEAAEAAAATTAWLATDEATNFLASLG